MIDLRFVRENLDAVRSSQEARGADPSSADALFAADERRRGVVSEFEALRAAQKTMGQQVKKASKEERPALLESAKSLAAQVKDAEGAVTEAESELREAQGAVANIVLDGVPPGPEENFVTIETVGEVPQLDFEPKDHDELGADLGVFDIPRGAKVSGARFYFLTGIGARLEMALMNMAMTQAMASGFTPIIAPALVRPEAMEGTGFLGAHAEEVYHLERDDLYLVGTSEVALAGFHSGEIVDLSGGPLRYAGFSSCFRREAGSYGKDTKGVFRVHWFDKVEMFCYTTPDQAEAEHQRLLDWEKQFLTALELPFRVIDVAAGDLGSSAARKYDCEAWFPSQGRYRELTSASNCTTYQARRLNVRYRGEDGKPATAATLNGTLCAITRTIACLLDAHQQKDGSVHIPAALQPFLGGLEVIEPVGKP
ncbi:seryl-tRNA synthetase [Antricoccus suffuscus]|uniref:Serine--tRNA ligase n=1 Tax=Antricoccus suffuscus TaxID=1629062 RepID=A0A2T1A3A4_9ACTN|nr:serine--tRNA ligase [Antricoccus suffuscus]PRZ42967.1 seryl-tRNA synthetase [Antricoccus suffuscus]